MVIGVLDSGMGGLTTLAELIRFEVANYYIYFADNKNSPYGKKNSEQIIDAVHVACKELIKLGAEVIVLACNTATSSVISKLRGELTLPIFGLEPAIRPALQNTQGKVLVLATEFTLKGHKWHQLIENFKGGFEVKSMPQLAELVDKYYPINMEYISKYIESELYGYKEIKSVVLGCTHYILVGKQIAKVLGNVEIYHGNRGIAKLISSIFHCPKSNVEIELIFSGEKLYERYANVLKSLVEEQ